MLLGPVLGSLAIRFSVLGSLGSRTALTPTPHRCFQVVTSLIREGSHMSPTKSLFDVSSRRISIFIVSTYVSLGCSGSTTRILRRTIKILLVSKVCEMQVNN